MIPRICRSCDYARPGTRIRSDNQEPVTIVECHLNPPVADAGWPMVLPDGWCSRYIWNKRRLS